MRKLKTLACLIISTLFISGCTTEYTLDKDLTPSQICEKVDVGDTIFIETKSGKKHNFEVISIDEQVIESIHKTFKYSNIEVIKITETSIAKTTGLILGTAALGSVVFYAILLTVVIGIPLAI